MTHFSPSTIPNEVRSLLTRLRQKIRFYVGIEGVATVAIALGVLFWLGLLVDWLLEPSVAWRIAIWGIAIAGLLFVGQRFFWRRMTAPLSAQSLALLLERHDSGLADHLSTTVSIAEAEARGTLSDSVAYDASTRDSSAHELADRTNAITIDAIRHLDFRGLLDARPCLQATVVAALLVGSVVLFAFQASETFGFWLRRAALTEEAWPRQVRLEVVGFPATDDGQRVATVARHDKFELTVHADLTENFVAPDRVQIRFELPDGRRGRDYLTRVGDPGATASSAAISATNAQQQVFRYQFKNVRENITFDVFGGDARVRDLQLQVVDRPEIVRIELDCEYPEYLGQGRQLLPYTRGMGIPLGSRLQIEAQTNKPITSFRVRSETNGLSVDETTTTRDMHSYQFQYGELVDEDSLSIQLTDQHGITNHEPYRMPLSVIPDELPQVAVRLRGIGTVVTPDATIPFQGEITDDYGLAEAWFEISVDDKALQRRAFQDSLQNSPDGRLEMSMAEFFDLRQPLDEASGQQATLKAGQQLAIVVVARDKCTLGKTPREGRSGQFLLDIVTPAELLMEIERRELAFRQHFEAIIEKVTDTRNLLTRIEFPPAYDTTEDATDTQSSVEENDGRVAALRRLRVAGARQNVLQAADELLGIAEGFENLHDQLVNNRIGDSELMSRLREQIARPLLEISTAKMPKLSSQLESTQQRLVDPAAATEALKNAIGQTDDILVDMRDILERMLELESYNEVVALLRGIITDQKGLNDRTKQRRRKSLQSLFDD